MPHKRSRGFLLVEAMVAALAMAIGLVAVSRSLGGSLQVLARLQEADRGLPIARGALDLSAALAQRGLPLRASDGACPVPYERAFCEITVEPLPPETTAVDPPAFRLVRVRVRSAENRPSFASLGALWPVEWVQE